MLGRERNATSVDISQAYQEFLEGVNEHEEDKGNLFDTAGAKALN